MIKVFYSGYGDHYSSKLNHWLPSAKLDGTQIRHQGFFVLREEDEVRFNIIGEAEIARIIYEEGNAPTYEGGNAPIPYEVLAITNILGEFSPIKINKCSQNFIDADTGNALKIISIDIETAQEDNSNALKIDLTNQNKSEMLTAVNQASMMFWSNAKRSDKDTWTTNQVVIDWLMKEHKFSVNIAKAAATIVRPEWAKK